MASRTRKEFRGRDFQRLKNLIKALDMISSMDHERSTYNAKEENINKRDRVLFIAWTKVTNAFKTIRDRAEVLISLQHGKDDPGV